MQQNTRNAEIDVDNLNKSIVINTVQTLIEYPQNIPNKPWDEITYPFTNFNSATVEVWECISNLIPHFVMDAINYLC